MDIIKEKIENISEEKLNSLLIEAILLATEKHAKQFDKSGTPYILHPLTVMGFIKEKDYKFNISCKIVAVLHDIVEDTDVTTEDLLNKGFPDYIVEAINLVTKKEGVSKNKYFKELKKNPISRIVKLADLTHNMDISRIPNPREKDYKRVEIYKEKFKYLSEE